MRDSKNILVSYLNPVLITRFNHDSNRKLCSENHLVTIYLSVKKVTPHLRNRGGFGTGHQCRKTIEGSIVAPLNGLSACRVVNSPFLNTSNRKFATFERLANLTPLKLQNSSIATHISMPHTDYWSLWNYLRSIH